MDGVQFRGMAQLAEIRPNVLYLSGVHIFDRGQGPE